MGPERVERSTVFLRGSCSAIELRTLPTILPPPAIPAQLLGYNPSMPERLTKSQAALGERAFGYYNRVFALAYRQTGDKADQAHEVASETYLRLLKSLAAKKFVYQSDQKLLNFLFTTANRLLINQHTRRTLADFPLPDRETGDQLGPMMGTAPDNANPETIIEQRQLISVIEQSVDSLHPTQRLILTLSVDAGLTANQIGARLHLSESAVKARLFRARSRLRKALSDSDLN